MDTLSDYLKWYGEFSFEDKPFTEVDNFVLSKLAYVIVADIRVDVPKCFRRVIDELEVKSGIQGSLGDYVPLIEEAASTKRFGEIRLVNHEDVYNTSLSAQFAALTFDLTDDVRVVAFRGTDDTLAGWKEDFMISFTETEAQKRALEYLQSSFDGVHKVYVVGHSKGANLALYASAHLDDKYQDQLAWIYMNDGPGLCPEVCDKSCVDKIKHKSTRYTPEYSVFGKLFEETDIPVKIVRSNAEGMLQHEIATWGVAHGRPDEVDTNSPGSIFINQILDQWIESVNNERRISFVNDVFSAFENNGMKTTRQIQERGPFAVEQILIEILNLDRSTVRTFMKLPVTAALDRAPDPLKAKKIKKNFMEYTWIPYMVMIMASAVLFCIPEYFLQVGISLVLFALIVFEIGVTIRHLKESHWNLQEESARVYVCIVMIGIYAMLLVKEDALFFIGSVAIGVSFLAWAYRNAIVFKNLCEETEKKERRAEKVKLVTEVVMLVILGAFILFAPKDTLKWYMIFLGIVFLVDGIVNLLMICHKAYKDYDRIRKRENNNKV